MLCPMKFKGIINRQRELQDKFAVISQNSLFVPPTLLQQNHQVGFFLSSFLSLQKAKIPSPKKDATTSFPLFHIQVPANGL